MGGNRLFPAYKLTRPYFTFLRTKFAYIGEVSAVRAAIEPPLPRRVFKEFAAVMPLTQNPKAVPGGSGGNLAVGVL